MVGTDFSSCAAAGLEAVEVLCRLWPVKKVHVLTVVSSDGEHSSIDALHRLAWSRLEALELRIQRADLVREVRVGAPATEIANYALAVGADLLVAGCHCRTGLHRALMGSITAGLVGVVRVPALVVPEALTGFDGRFSDVMAAVDLTSLSRSVVQAADMWASPSEGRVRVLSIFQPPLVASDEDGLLPHYVGQQAVTQRAREHEGSLRRLVRAAGVRASVDIEVVAGAPSAGALAEAARSRNVDLVVVGSSARGSLRRLLMGSTAYGVVAGASRPVLVVPAEVREEAPEGSLLPGLSFAPQG